jgi:hypothetical protein
VAQDGGKTPVLQIPSIICKFGMIKRMALKILCHFISEYMGVLVLLSAIAAGLLVMKHRPRFVSGYAPLRLLSHGHHSRRHRRPYILENE